MLINLNLDIYHLIFQLIDRNDVVAISSTCHSLRNFGVRYMLQNGVRLHTTAELLSFHLFMLRDTETRFRLLTDLHFGDNITASAHLPTVETLLIAYILEHATSLLKLEFVVVEGLPVTEPHLAIVRALERLCTLRELTMQFYHGSFCETFLSAVPVGSLAKVHLAGQLEEEGSIHSDMPGSRCVTCRKVLLRKLMDGRADAIVTDLERETVRYAPLAILPRFNETLEEVKITGFLELPPDVLNPFACPLVWRLHINQQEDPRTHAWSVGSVVQTFPNVRELRVKAFFLEDNPSMDDHQQMLDTQRAIWWNHLEYVTGESDHMYLFALRGPVDMLHIYSWCYADLYMIESVIKSLKPKKVAYHFSEEEFDFKLEADNYSTLITTTPLAYICRSLQNLRFDFRYAVEGDVEERMVMRDILEELALALESCCSLAELYLGGLRGYKAVEMRSENDNCWSASLREMCPDAYARRCMGAAASLQEMVLEGPGHGTKSESQSPMWCWRITTQSDGKRAMCRTERPSPGFFFAHDNDQRRITW